MYVLASVMTTSIAFDATGDLGRLIAGGVRLFIGLAGIGMITRGSVIAARIAVALLGLGGLVSLVLAAMAHDVAAMAITGALGLAFLAMALRLATSAPFWSYVRAQRPD